MTIVVPIGGSGASQATLASLKTSIAGWLNRTDLDFIIPDFVTMAEAEFSRDVSLRGSFQMAVDTGYAPTGEIRLPDDMLELRELQFQDQPLDETPYGDPRMNSHGPFFERVGNVAQVAGRPEGTYRLTYVQKLPALEFDSDSNWLLTAHFDVYLWKCCEIGSVWLRDAEAAQGYSTKYQTAAAQLLRAHNYHGWGGAPLAVQAPGVV